MAANVISMGKSLTGLLLAFLLGSLLPLPAAAQASGVAEGLVLNGTTNTPAAGVPVTVQVFSRMTQIEERQVTTGADGRFRAEGLPADPDNRYIISLTYAGLKYSPDTAVNPSDPQPPPTVTVYETTPSSEAISVLSASIAVTSVDSASGLIQVLEVVTIANRSNVAYTGDLLANPEQGGVLRLPLPGPALDLELGDGFTEMPLATPTRIVTRTPAFPGESVFVFAYKLPYDQATYVMKRAFDYPVERAAFIVSANGPKATSGELTTAETVSINDKAHLSLSRKGLAPGQEVAITLSGLPPLTAPGSGGGPSLDTALRGASIALTALAVLTVAIYALARRRARPQPAPDFAAESSKAPQRGVSNPLAAERHSLVRAIARLDDQYESGTLTRERYEAERAGLKARLTDVALMMSEGAS